MIALLPDGAVLFAKCSNCGEPFRYKKKSTAQTCSRSCAVALSWKDPEKAAKRCASIEVARNTPESRRLATEVNNRRWAEPGSREKLAEQSRERWAQPRMRKKITKAIKKAQGTPEARARASYVRKQAWQDEAYREAVVGGMRRHHGTAEARANFSQLLTERWRDPVIRDKMTAANIRKAQDPELRARMSAEMKRRWATDEKYRMTALAALKLYVSSPETVAIKSAKMKALWADPIWQLRQRNLIAAAAAAAAAAGKKNAGLEAIASSALRSTTDLIVFVDKLVPRGLPDFMREDICQDIMVALLDGSMKFKDAKQGAAGFLTTYRKMFPDKFGPISLDAPIPGTDGLTLIDTIADDHAHF